TVAMTTPEREVTPKTSRLRVVAIVNARRRLTIENHPIAKPLEAISLTRTLINVQTMLLQNLTKETIKNSIVQRSQVLTDRIKTSIDLKENLSEKGMKNAMTTERIHQKDPVLLTDQTVAHLTKITIEKKSLKQSQKMMD